LDGDVPVAATCGPPHGAVYDDHFLGQACDCSCLCALPGGKNPTRNPHTNYPRLSRLKPNADGMQAITQCRSPRGRLWRGLTGGYAIRFSRKWLMATDDADPGTTSRVLARPVAEATKGRMGFTGCGERLAPDSSRDRGIQDIVAGRLRVMIGT
jgi:hypothetical protein